MRDYQESLTTGQTHKTNITDRQTHGQTDAGQRDPYVPLCFAGDIKTGMGEGLTTPLMHQIVWHEFGIKSYYLINLCYAKSQ